MEDRVLATEKDITNLYNRTPRDTWMRPLYNHDLLPLTLQKLTKDVGQAFLHFTNHTYFTGMLRQASRGRFRPTIYAPISMLEDLLSDKLAPLSHILDIDREENSPRLRFTEGAGAFGRLQKVLGVPTTNAKNSSGRKWKYDLNLPKYLLIIAEEIQRQDDDTIRRIGYRITEDLFSDRFFVNRFTNSGKKFALLRFHKFPTKVKADRYGDQVRRWLNCVLPKQTLEIESGQVVSHIVNKEEGTYRPIIRFTPENLGNLILHEPYLLNVSS